MLEKSQLINLCHYVTIEMACISHHQRKISMTVFECTSPAERKNTTHKKPLNRSWFYSRVCRLLTSQHRIQNTVITWFPRKICSFVVITNKNRESKRQQQEQRLSVPTLISTATKILDLR